ncbi:MAG: exonuclease domain-containing protein [Megasphaera sp.]|jgi:inhibitor of KinA sporulation pathway (predicted exonuclease)|nr:exonuclease domain-containing protein [Megasphaera sp.]MCH4188634.1 exonuclease domain-containing protein [Megasphaera sp.]MCH4218513.1 exonuclease domain-containing protein [Megasphaera sp.]
MKAVFVDFEMNPIGKKQKEVRRICKGEIIEIGAVKIDEAGKEIASYKEYVRPQYTTKMNATCQELTGITMDMLADAPHFRQAFDHFLSWCREENDDDYEMYAWSENDWHQLTCEMRLKQLDMTESAINWMLTHWQNFQQIYCNLLGLDNVISLDKAVSTLGETFDGQMHDALWDARNTSKLYTFSQKKNTLHDMMKPIIAATKPAEPLTFSLADAFRTARHQD